MKYVENHRLSIFEALFMELAEELTYEQFINIFTEDELRASLYIRTTKYIASEKARQAMIVREMNKIKRYFNKKSLDK